MEQNVVLWYSSSVQQTKIGGLFWTWSAVKQFWLDLRFRISEFNWCFSLLISLEKAFSFKVWIQFPWADKSRLFWQHSSLHLPHSLPIIQLALVSHWEHLCFKVSCGFASAESRSDKCDNNWGKMEGNAVLWGPRPCLHCRYISTTADTFTEEGEYYHLPFQGHLAPAVSWSWSHSFICSQFRSGYTARMESL